MSLVRISLKLPKYVLLRFLKLGIHIFGEFTSGFRRHIPILVYVFFFPFGKASVIRLLKHTFRSPLLFQEFKSEWVLSIKSGIFNKKK